MILQAVIIQFSENKGWNTFQKDEMGHLHFMILFGINNDHNLKLILSNII